MDRITDRLMAAVSLDAVIERAVTEMLPNLLVGVLVFAGFYLVWRIMARALTGVVNKAEMDKTAAGFAQALLKYTVLTLGVVTTLAQFGVNMMSLMTSLGIAGITLGFAARDALSNVISGFFIFVDRPFVIGDLIEVGSHYGRVDNITMRSTRVITPDGRMLAIPNTEMLNSIVASYTNFPNLRIDLTVNIAVDQSVALARETLLTLVRDDDRFLTDPAPSVQVTELNDYNVAVMLSAWLREERKHISVRAELREAAFNGLNAAGVQMPFETLTLNPISVHQVSAPQ